MRYKARWIFWISACLFLLILIAFLWPPQDGTKWDWELSVGEPLHYTATFAWPETAQSIAIQINQLHVGKGKIRYSLVHVNQSGQLVHLEHLYVEGDVRGTGITIVFDSVAIPPNQLVKIEVYNYGSCLCNGSIALQTIE